MAWADPMMVERTGLILMTGTNALFDLIFVPFICCCGMPEGGDEWEFADDC